MQDDRLPLVKSWFKKHRRQGHWKDLGGSQVRPAIEYLCWAEPGTCINQIVYRCTGNHLFVSGDLECAVYQWSDKVTLEWIAEHCSLDYFEQKCQASPRGHRYQQWDEDQACEFLNDHIENDDGFHADENTKDDMLRALESQEQWNNWLWQYGDETLGVDAWEFNSIGMRTDLCCLAHLVGLQMAFGKLKEG
jgi:hypothetical protein